jgi:hypothetical protein
MAYELLGLLLELKYTDCDR